ncbi:MAG: hypothetical protein Q7K42_03855 [Candidatus Diapherotrites archaeon]|nr:hypothetical protein [Candidatus Diapherotrites archaeon]
MKWIEKNLSFLLRALLFLVGVFLVVYAITRFDEVFSRIRTIYFITGEWYDLILIIIFAFAIGYVLKWLLKWEFHLLAGHKRHR